MDMVNSLSKKYRKELPKSRLVCHVQQAHTHTRSGNGFLESLGRECELGTGLKKHDRVIKYTKGKIWEADHRHRNDGAETMA